MTATIHQKKAGQWGKQKANGLHDRLLNTLGFGMLVLGTIGGFLMGRYGVAVGVWLFLCPVLLMWLVRRQLVKPMDKWSRERVKFMRGAQAEGLIAWHLQELPPGWHVFHNLPCAQGGDIDHIVVGPGGLFVISTKSYRGYVKRNAGGTVLLNGEPMTRDLDEAMKNCMWVKTRLTAALGNQVPWMQPVLALPVAYVDMPPTETPVWILNENVMMETINAEKPKWKLSTSRIEQIAAELDLVAQSAS